MSGPIELTHQSGVWGIAILGVGGTTLVLSMIAAFLAWAMRAKARVDITLAVLATTMLMLTFLVAAIGTWAGFTKLTEMMSFLDGEEAARLEEYGPSVAMAPLRLALVLGVPAAVFTASVWIRGIKAFKTERGQLTRPTSVPM